MADAIVDYRIAGTRITVWDVLHHLDHDWPLSDIADVLGVSLESVQAAVDFIREHHDEVMDVHRQIEERNARGNPPEVRRKLAHLRAKRLEWLTQREQATT